jgi:hypothetical protein
MVRHGKSWRRRGFVIQFSPTPRNGNPFYPSDHPDSLTLVTADMIPHVSLAPQDNQSVLACPFLNPCTLTPHPDAHRGSSRRLCPDFPSGTSFAPAQDSAARTFRTHFVRGSSSVWRLLMRHDGLTLRPSCLHPKRRSSCKKRRTIFAAAKCGVRMQT